MALTKARVREILSEAGIATEHLSSAVEAIIDGHTASINALREEREMYRSEAEKLPDIQKELEDLKAAEAAAKSAEHDFDALKKEFDTYKAEQEAKAARAAKESALSETLQDTFTETGVAKILKYTDLDSVELGEDGKLKGKASLMKFLREEWPEYIQITETKGADTPTPPTGVAPVTGKTAAEILAIKDDAEMVKAIESNPSAFGLA